MLASNRSPSPKACHAACSKRLALRTASGDCERNLRGHFACLGQGIVAKRASEPSVSASSASTTLP